MELANRLSNHGSVSAVLYPGLAHHPGHEVARRQMQGGFGGMLSIRVRGGAKAAIATAARVRVWKRATSLGEVEALIEPSRIYRGRELAPARPICCGYRPESKRCRSPLARYRRSVERIALINHEACQSGRTRAVLPRRVSLRRPKRKGSGEARRLGTIQAGSEIPCRGTPGQASTQPSPIASL